MHKHNKQSTILKNRQPDILSFKLFINKYFNMGYFRLLSYIKSERENVDWNLWHMTLSKQKNNNII